MKKINIVTLGCSKNVVDSEKILAQLAAYGYRVAHNSEDTDAKIVVINTCGFIGDAKEESVNTILSFAHARQQGAIEKLYVIGCLSERYRDELREELPEVDNFFGARNIGEIVTELGHTWNEEVGTSRCLSTPGHYAYLKISEGCDRSCGFCAIPSIRGGHVSVPMESLEREAAELASKGVKELIVIAQDTTYYGVDLYGKRMLPELLGRLCRIEGIEWIRLHYAFPTGFPEGLLEVMATEPKICPYIDIPVQHVSDSQLSAMRRGHGSGELYELIGKMRNTVPEIAIRTTLLVGYPGETDEDFRQLLSFVEEVGFDRLGVFPYSEEEGTYSAERLTDDIPQSVKEQRAETIMQVQAEISYRNNQRRVGTTGRVIVDSIDAAHVTCRSRFDSPEVDQEIHLDIKEFGKCGLGLPSPGDIITIEYTGADRYDLYGIPVA